MTAETIIDTMVEEKSQTVTIESIEYYVLLGGPSQGPLVVLIHALMSNHHIWDLILPDLHKAGYRTLRYDHIGHNLTTPPRDETKNMPGVFSFDSFVQHLDQIIATCTENTNAPRAVIGCSIGGVLALRWRMMHPPNPDIAHKTKVICCAAPGMTSLEASKPKWRQRIDRWEAEGTVDDLAKETVARWYPPPLPADFDHDRALEIVRSCTLDGYKICVWATMNYDYTEQCHQITEGEDVMVLVGENDHNIGPREVMHSVARSIKGSTYVMMKDTGHIPPLHWPEKFVKIALDFLHDR